MNTTFIFEKDNPDNYARIIEKNFREMTDGLVSEKEAVEFITEILPEAKPCANDSNLWFWMFDEPSNMPSDCRVEYVYEATYRLCGIIIFALTKYEEVKKIQGIKDILRKTLKGCTGREFMGHGFERFDSFITAMRVFAKSNINKFFDDYSGEFDEFETFYKGRMSLLEDLASNRIRGDWGESYSNEATAILELLSYKECPVRVFVYGTLMRGKGAHHYLEKAKSEGDFVLEGYGMYNLGSFPGILPCCRDCEVIGEVYEVTTDMIPRLDQYEGEGSLYIRKEECVRNENDCLYANVYIYNGEPDGKRMMGKWGE